MSEIAFRKPTFKNPLPAILKSTGTFLAFVFASMIALGESAGRARAASQLASMGYHKEARSIMLKE